MSAYDPHTGVLRLSVDTVDARGYAGDDACGEAISAVYISDDGEAGACAEIVTYVREYEDGTFGIDENGDYRPRGLGG